MAISVAAVIAGGYDDTDATSYTTGSGSPTGDALQLLYVAVTRSGSAPAAPTVTGCGLTWVEVETITYGSDITHQRRLSLFRAMGSSPSSGTLTIDLGGVTHSSAIWSWIEATGVDTSGTNGSGAVVQSGKARRDTAGESGTSQAVTLSAFASSDNRGVYGVAFTANERATPDTSWTEIHDLGSTAPVGDLETQWSGSAGADNTAYASWSTGGRSAGIAVELAVAVAVSALPSGLRKGARSRAAELARRARRLAGIVRPPVAAPPPPGEIVREATIADAGITTGDTVVSGTVTCEPGEYVFAAVDVRDETDTWTCAWTGGGAFTQIVDLNAARAQGGMTVFYYYNAGSTITDTITATSVGNIHPATLSGSVWSGVDSSDWGNYATAVTSGSDNANLTGSITPEGDSSVVIAFAGTRGDALTLQGDETMIEEGTTYGAGGDRVTLDHFRKNGTHDVGGGAVTVGGTSNLSGVCDWRLVMLALKPPAGPAELPPGGVLLVPAAIARASRW